MGIGFEGEGGASWKMACKVWFLGRERGSQLILDNWFGSLKNYGGRRAIWRSLSGGIIARTRIS